LRSGILPDGRGRGFSSRVRRVEHIVPFILVRAYSTVPETNSSTQGGFTGPGGGIRYGAASCYTGPE